MQQFVKIIHKLFFFFDFSARFGIRARIFLVFRLECNWKWIMFSVINILFDMRLNAYTKLYILRVNQSNK